MTNLISQDAPLANIRAGLAAKANAADLAAVATTGAYADLSGAPTIPVAGILPNNTRLNGVEHFYQTTKPTERGDASALVVGDRWWKSDDGTEWFWNGTYWLTAKPESINWPTISNFGATASPNSQEVAAIQPYWVGVFVEKWWVFFLSTATNGWNESNFTTYQVRRNNTNGTAKNIGGLFEINDITNDLSSDPIRTHTINEYVDIQNPLDGPGGGGLRWFSYAATKTGTASNVVAQVRLSYRGVA